MTDILIRRGIFEHRHIQERRPCEEGGRDWGYKPKNVKDCPLPPEAGRKAQYRLSLWDHKKGPTLLTMPGFQTSGFQNHERINLLF